MATISSGLIVRALPRTSYVFSGVAASQTFSFPLVQKVAAGSFTEATWMIRIHTANIGANAQLVFTAIDEGYDFGDPGTIFFAAGPTLVIPAGTTGPVYDTPHQPVLVASYVWISQPCNQQPHKRSPQPSASTFRSKAEMVVVTSWRRMSSADTQYSEVTRAHSI
jgi:hypothetical protein